MVDAATISGAWFTSTNREYAEKPIRVGMCAQAVAATETIASTSVDLADDRVKMLPIPQGAKIVAIWYSVTDMDNGGPTLSIDVVCAETTDGTLTETDLNTPATFGQATTTGWLLPDAGDVWLHEVGVCDNGIAEIRLKVTDAATTPAQGTVSLVAWYY